jgi:hypothetical protein
MSIDIPLVDENPSDADVHFLDDQINRYNFETTGISDGRIISFLIRDERADPFRRGKARAAESFSIAC